MADEQKTVSPTLETTEGKVTFNSQADFDAVIQRRLSKVKEQYADYDETKAKLEQLIQAQTERDNKELTELQKLQKEAEEAKKQTDELKTYKDKLISYETAQAEKFNTLMVESEFTDAQMARVNKLPLTDREDMIKDLVAAKQLTPPADAGKTGKLNTNFEPADKLRNAKSIRERDDVWRATFGG